MGSDGNWTRMEIYMGGAHIATYADGTTYFRHTNRLGSLRALTTTDNPIPATTCSAYPFGDGQTCKSGSSTRNLFTDYVHDGETSLEHSWFRQYSSRVGRFYSPDPVLGTPGDPQSWNRYAYVQNNPTTLSDPLGRNLSFGDWGDGGGGCPPSDFNCGTFDWMYNGGGGPGDKGVGGTAPSTQDMLRTALAAFWLRMRDKDVTGCFIDFGSIVHCWRADGDGWLTPDEQFLNVKEQFLKVKVPANTVPANTVPTNTVPTSTISATTGYKQQYCSDQANKAALEAILPYGHLLLGGDYKQRRVARPTQGA